MYKILGLLLILGVFQCDKPEVNAENVLVGEWRYVGTYSHTVDYECYVCDNFDYNKCIYRINFEDANNYSANINLLTAKGVYNVGLDKNDGSIVSGTFENIDMQILNKPFETPADTKVKNMLLESTGFYVALNARKKGYDELTLSSNNNEYLLFVRK
jgi:hypothetical protein